jgi:catechol 2,3-dioxygenase-like lactoylglutathione lyase family enzyme
MLQNTKVFSSFSVSDLAKAKEFYENKLGLKSSAEMPGLLHVELEGNQKLLIYEKDAHLPATFTVLNFIVRDLEKVVDELTNRGVTFEQYQGERINTDRKGIFRNGGMAIAWFKDPAGNILSVVESAI